MTCDQVRQLLHAYLDDELDAANAVQVEQHLPKCAGCLEELEAIRALRAAAAQPGVYFSATQSLRDQVRRAIRAEAPEPEARSSGRRMAWSVLAAALLLTIGFAFWYSQRGQSAAEVAEVVGSHVRSLEANHLLDVESTDQHTVKPWFAGKIEFSPPVVDLAGDGFPLIGGRLDYLMQQKVAALIYRRNKHFINLFIWPGETSDEADSKDGYNLVRFECKGMTCWAVSDLNPVELQQFADLFKAQNPATTR